jgi:hypothetical protein
MTVANGKAKAQTVRLFFTMFLLLSAISGCATNKSPAAHNKTDYSYSSAQWVAALRYSLDDSAIFAAS